MRCDLIGWWCSPGALMVGSHSSRLSISVWPSLKLSIRLVDHKMFANSLHGAFQCKSHCRLSSAALLRLPPDGAGVGDFKGFQVCTQGAAATSERGQKESGLHDRFQPIPQRSAEAEAM